jgi:hypothetical protein
MAHAPQQHKLRVRNAPREILRVLGPDEFVVLALHDGHRHTGGGKLFGCGIRLRLHHFGDSRDECIKVVGCG